MRTFLINLDRDIDRLDWMKEEAARVDLKLERISACQGDQLKDWLRPMFFDSDEKPFAHLNNGEIGCYASHLTIHKRIVDENIDEPVLVLEDDVRFRPHFPYVIGNLARLPVDWEIVRLTNRPKTAFIAISQLAESPDQPIEVIRYWRVPLSTGAYLINKKGARKFLDAYEKRMRPIDQDIRFPWEHRLVTYGISPTPIQPDNFESSIDKLSIRKGSYKKKRIARPPAPQAISQLTYRLERFGVPLALKCLVKNF